MENNNQELNNIETIDFEDNNQPVVSESQPLANDTGINVHAETVVNNNSTIPVDDINSTIPADVVDNPQAQTLNAIEPEKQEEQKENKKSKNNSLVPLILVFALLMAFILFLPKINELITGI